MDPEKQASYQAFVGIVTVTDLSQREIASMGGKASSGSFEPGSEKAAQAGRKGGLAS